MTEPEGSTTPATVTEEPVVTETVTTEEPVTVEVSDAELRAWARDNGIDGVPASGKLSATWRDQILAAMASAQPEEAEVATPLVEEPPVVEEYRSVFQAPSTFVTSQYYTS